MGQPEHSHFVLIASPAMSELAESIRQKLAVRAVNMPLYIIEYTAFANGEFRAKIPHSVRGQHIFFLHDLQHPDPNIAIMKMLLVMDAMRRASVSGITLVTPYLPYLRQDRKDQARVPISARLIADLIEANKSVKQLITIDMHAEQEQGFFSIPVDNLTGVRLFTEHILARFGSDMSSVVAVAADFGAAVRTRRLAKALGDIPVSIFEKRRPAANQAEIVSVIGADMKGKRAVIYEDIIDSGHTIREVAKALKSMGALEVYIYAMHGIFSGDAERAFAADNFSIHCSDSIPRSEEYYAQHKWLTRVSIDDYFAEAIFEATQAGGSISKLSM